MTKVLRVLIPLGIIGVGIFILIALKNTRPVPEKKERVNPGIPVDTVVVATKNEEVRVDAKGTVVPARDVRLSPEVSGRVSWMSPELVPGGRFKKGQVLVRLDARDYKLAVDQQYATVDRAKTELRLEKSRKKVAEKEWELFGPNGAKKGTANESGGKDPAELEEVVALREPQMRTAKVAVKSAQSGLERAKLAVSKTIIRAPFNAMVRERQVEMGQLVGPSTPLAMLVGTDAYWVQVSVPMEDLSWIRVPGVGTVKQGEGSPARILQTVGGEVLERSGRVVRLLGDVDPVGRMARIMVEIADPLGLAKDGGDKKLPLLLGSYIRVQLEGGEVREVIAIPRLALREGDSVYLRSKEDTLEVRKVQVIWRRQSEVLIGDGLSAGDEVIVSPVSTPTPGLKLRKVEAAKQPSDKRKAAKSTGEAEKAAAQ